MDENKDQHVTAAPVTSESVDLEEDKKAWRMPEPVFRQSTGHLPRGFQKQFPGNEDETAEPTSAASSANVNGAGAAASAPAPAPAVPSEPASEIQPQPDIIEDTAPEQEPASVPPVERSRMRIFLVVMGILAMAVFAIAFVAVIYYLFFYLPGESNSVLN